MPPSNIHVVVGTGAIVVITVVAGIAIAVYESPQLREFAEDCRRKIAIALHSLGDEINPNRSESSNPRFNRPEDAEGFMMSRAEPGVDADEESRRRQREELMYWNQIRLEKLEREKKRRAAETGQRTPTRGASFDDFLQQDETAESGTFIYNSSAEVRGGIEDGLLRRRMQGVRGLDTGAAFANPFGDENHIELEEQHATDARLMSPERSEISSEDLYGVEDYPRPSRESTRTLVQEPVAEESLVDVSESTPQPTPEPALESYESSYMTADQDEPESAYASIHAWAENSHHASFYSPLPVTPQAPLSVYSEPEMLSGQATPTTDSASLAGSGEDIGHDNASSIDGEGRRYDIMSEDGEVIHTPGSWTEVGSVVSDSDAGLRS